MSDRIAIARYKGKLLILFPLPEALLEGLNKFACDAILPQYETMAKPLLESTDPPYEEVPEVRLAV